MFSSKLLFDSDCGVDKLQPGRSKVRAAKENIAHEVALHGQPTWDRQTGWMELSKPLMRAVRGNYGIPSDASNAFFKAIELFNILRPTLIKLDTVRIFDNASLPGDFVRAMIWWAKHVDWRANSLVGGLDDRFRLLADHPERWMMRPDMNGDVTVEENHIKIMNDLGAWRADIYTSDLGFATDCFREEESHFTAHRAQCILGMKILREGGTMVVKTFTMSTPETVELMNILASCFEQFHVVKPATSKPDNSECYWICLGFKSVIQPHKSICPQSLVDISTYLTSRQSQKITQNISQFRKRVRPDFTSDVHRWCELHIGADRLGKNHVTTPNPQS